MTTFCSMCLSGNRWVSFDEDISLKGTNCWFVYYDNETIIRQNKFNPFSDKILILWVKFDVFPEVNSYMERYEINLDKKTFKILNRNKIKERHIEPESFADAIYKQAKRLY